MERLTNKEGYSPDGPITSIVWEYHDVYGAECSKKEWDELDVITKMRFASTHGVETGILTVDQAEAVQAAIGLHDNQLVDLPPMGIAFLADVLHRESNL